MIEGQSNEVELHFLDMRRGKPPSALLYFDLTLRNTGSDARWFILPGVLYWPPQASYDGGISDAEIVDYSGTGQVTIGHFMGTGGFKALQVPAGGTIIVHRFGIKFWGDTPDRSLPVEVISAAAIRVGSEPVENWFGGPALCAAPAEVSIEQGQSRYTYHTPDGREVPIEWIDGRRWTVPVVIR